MKVIYWKINWNFPWQIITSLNISLSDENVFGSWPSFSTFKAHIFFFWKFTNKEDRKKIQNGHMIDSTKQRVSSRFNVGRNCLHVICGHSWFFKRLLPNKFFLHRKDLEAQRILNQQTLCHLFISDWKNIVLPGVTLSFKQVKRRKVSLLYMWLLRAI